MSATKALETKPTQIIVYDRETVDNLDLQESFPLQEHVVEGREELDELSCWGPDSRSLSAYLGPPSDKRELMKTVSERAGSQMEGAVRRAFSMRRRAGQVGGYAYDQHQGTDESVVGKEEKERMLASPADYKRNNNLFGACKRMFGF